MTPLQFTPLLKRIRWGGTRLGSVLGKPIGDKSDYAESWEFSDQEGDQSVVATGPLAGTTLARLVRDHNEDLFGQHAGLEQFPLLVKFLDATDRLSVQVHPNDEQARQIDPQANGKTECWVIIDREPGSRIYSGLKPNIGREELLRHIEAGSVEECLHVVDVNPGDCVFIPAGTVHAIGEGILLAEVQQMSNITYRLYDWGRVGADGKPRPLHVDESLACIDFDRGPVDPVTPEPIASFRESLDAWYETEELISCPYFILQRHRGNAPLTLTRSNRFHCLMVIDGHCHIASGDKSLPLKKGQSVLVPAACSSLQIVPDGEVWQRSRAN